MIKIQNYDKKKQKLSFVTDMPISLANAIRRSVLEIPVMAIDEVDIIKNDSALYDEIGLIPIKTTKTDKEIKFKLKEVGPKTVYSDDIKPSVGTDLKLPIVILDKEQEVEMICNACLGKGIKHIKYSPGLIYYRHSLDIDVLEFVSVDENGKVNYDEEDLKNRGISQEQIDKIKSVKEVGELIFEIESWGQMDVKDIVVGAIDALDNNLKVLGKAVK